MHPRSAAAQLALAAGLCIAGSALAQVSPTPQAPQDDPAFAAFKGADTNLDGMLSREESAKLPLIFARFAELDINKDGQLSWDEFKAGYRAAP